MSAWSAAQLIQGLAPPLPGFRRERADFTVVAEFHPRTHLKPQFRNWNFYSDGGFSDVVWKLEKERWYMHYKGVRPDGQRWTMVGIIKPIDKDSFTWQVTEHIVGGKPVPNSPEIKIVRK